MHLIFTEEVSRQSLVRLLVLRDNTRTRTHAHTEKERWGEKTLIRAALERLIRQKKNWAYVSL